MSSHLYTRPRRFPGAGSQARPLAVSFLLAASLATFTRGLQSQTATDAYWAAGSQRQLTIHLDSLGVVPYAAMTPNGLQSIVAGFVPGAQAIRPIGDKGWVLSIPAASRAAVAQFARRIAGDPQIRWAGMAVRTGPPGGPPAFVTDEMLVRFGQGVTAAQQDSLAQVHQTSSLRSAALPEEHHVLLSDVFGGDAIAVSRAYYESGLTTYAFPNFHLPVETASMGTPNDPRFAEQWHLLNRISNVVPRPDIRATEAWDIELGDPEIVIAVLEPSGFEVTHPELRDRRWWNPWETGAVPPPDPLNKSNDLNGWNFQGCEASTYPLTDGCGSAALAVGDQTHGTQVAGMAAATQGNGAGGSGVCPLCSVMFVRMGTGDDITADIHGAAVDYAWMMGADIINMSWNTPFSNDAVLQALERAAQHGRGGTNGTPLVAIPYNDYQDFDFCSGPEPQMASHAMVLSVRDTDVDDKRTNGGMGSCLSLLAPGSDVLMPGWTDALPPVSADYHTDSGNSFAAPVVSGTIGLMLSLDPTLTRAQVYDILKSTADKVDSGGYDASGHSDTHGYGRVNACAALQAVQVGMGVTPEEGLCDGVSTPEPPCDCPPLPPPCADSGSGNCSHEVSPPTCDVNDGDLGDCDTLVEIGVRSGVTSNDGTTTETIAALPGGGPLGAPVVYASIFPDPHWMLDLQFGIQRVTTSASFPAQHLMVLSGLVALRSGPWYVGPSVGYRNRTTGGSGGVRWGFGGALGARTALGSLVAGRVEILYRHWSTLSVHEWGLGVGLGVRLR